jgi:predicted Fe-S protein YdhL (DUF1289 family)
VSADDGEDRRLKPCPICRAHIGRADLWELSGRVMCQGCGRDEVIAWNRLMIADEIVNVMKGPHDTEAHKQRDNDGGGSRDGLPFLW